MQHCQLQTQQQFHGTLGRSTKLVMGTDTMSAQGGAGDRAEHGGGGIGDSRYFAGPADNNGVYG
jgi:hypothetical protein